MSDFFSNGDKKERGFFDPPTPTTQSAMETDLKNREKKKAAAEVAKKHKQERIDRKNATQKRDEDRARAIAEKQAEGLTTGTKEEAPRLLDVREYLLKSSGQEMNFPTVERAMPQERAPLPGEQILPSFLRKKF